MKKSLSLLLAIIMVAGIFSALPLTAGATSDFTYTIADDEVEITRYNGAGGNVVIPDTIDNCPVTKIGSEAFFDCDEITGVTISDSVAEIGERAFCDCSGLKSIEIPEYVEVIGNSAFESCDVLESVTVKAYSGYIGENAFASCPVLRNVVIEDGIRTIKRCAFYDCNLLMCVTVPETVTQIGEYALGYYYNSETKAITAFDGFVVCGYDDSEAEIYAKANGFIFESLTPVEVYVDIERWKVPYTGKVIKPAVKVTDSKGNKLVKNTDYTLKYPANPVNAGAYSVEVKLKGSYEELGVVYGLYYITTVNNTMTVKVTNKKVSYNLLKKKAATVAPITVKKPIGKVTYKKISGNSKITVNTSTGKFTVKKGTRKGTYSVKVKVAAKGDRNHKSATKTVTAKIIVK